jgi:hypothetical protein
MLTCGLSFTPSAALLRGESFSTSVSPQYVGRWENPTVGLDTVVIKKELLFT